MNKKLIAVAVAGMFVAPAAALAQTSVTITGKVMASDGNYKLYGRAAGAAGKNSEILIRDESSRIIFLVREDLGGGLNAIGKVDLRPSIADTGAFGPTGESFVGLDSKSWGTIAIGRFDFHYGNHASYTGVHGGLLTNPTALFDVAAAGILTIANQTRTNNAIRYGSPKWGDMFEVVLGYSSNPTAASTGPGLSGAVGIPATQISFNTQNESDLRSTVRKGNAWNINPKLWGKNWEVGYSFWLAKPDFALAAPSNSTLNGGTGTGLTLGATNVLRMRGDSLYGTYVWGGFRAGLAWNKSRADITNLQAATTSTFVGAGSLPPGATGILSKRSVWGVPLAYNWGNHNIYFDYYRTSGDKAPAFVGFDTRANFFGLTYAYDLSKRTTAALSYSRINNGAAANFSLFAAATPGGSGSVNLQSVGVGEDPRYLAVTLQHRF